MSKLGMVVTYTPTLTEFPMAFEQPLVAIITAWNEDTNKASLVVFPPGANYVMPKGEAEEGTTPGTFQQFPSGTTASTAAASSHSGAQNPGQKAK